MNAVNMEALDLRRMNEKDYLFNYFSGIARAHAIAMVPHFEERERLAKQRSEHTAAAQGKREAARILLEEAGECDEIAKRIDEQMKALR